MKKQRIYSDAVSEPPDGLWSNAIKVGQQLFVSGMTARGKNLNDIEGDDEYQQAVTVFRKIRHYVDAAGGVMNDVVKMTIFVTRIENNQEVWRARREFFCGDFPTCTLVEVSKLARPDILLEIEATAIIGCSE